MTQTEKTIRSGRPEDLDELMAIEEICFPPEQAARRKDIEERLEIYPEGFYILEKDGKIVSFVNGMTTNEADLRDEMYENASLHQPDGDWQMIFGVDTHPDYRRQGLAGQVIEACIADAKAKGRQGVVLTCLDHLIHYYASFGFVDEGISASTHGDVVWHQMRLCF